MSAPKVDVLAVLDSAIQSAEVRVAAARSLDAIDCRQRAVRDLYAARAALAKLAKAGKQLLPRNLCLNNPRWPDSTKIPLTATLGELRAFSAAIASIGGAA